MPAEKFPGGTVGLVVSATDENQQDDIWVHCDPRLVAVNVNGDPELATLVYDLNESSEYDRERSARLQSMMRVIKKPMGGDNAIAWQLGSSGKGDTGGGWVIDGSTGGDYRIGAASKDAGGPLDVGDGKCLHHVGDDEDGNPISSLHITTQALFRKTNFEDGPIRFEDKYEEGEDGDHVFPVHLGWTGGDWAFYTKIAIGVTQPIRTPTGRRPVKTQIGGGVTTGGRTLRTGGFDWRPPWVSTQKPFVPTGNPVANPNITKGKDGTSETSPPPVSSGPKGQHPANGDKPLEEDPEPPRGTDEWAEWNKRRKQKRSGVRFGDPFSFGNFEGGNVAPTGQATLDQAMLETRHDVTTPALVGRASTSDRKKKDTSHMRGGDFANSGPAKAQFKETPISGQLIAYGAQGGTTGGSGGYNETTGGSGDPWAYTSKPGKSRFYAGTCPGGFVLLPPEVQMGDYENGFTPDTVDISTTYLLSGPGTYFGAGIPDTVNGTLQDGWSWGMDTATGDLLFRTHSNGADASDQIKLELASGDIYWKSGTSFYGRFAHAITAARVWTFPDVTGTVAIETATASLGGGSTATLGTIGGSGPTSAGQASWEKIMCSDGTQRFFPTWV